MVRLGGAGIGRLAELELRRGWLLAAALAVQLLLGQVPSGWRGAGLATSAALVGLWLAANLPRRPRTIRLAISVVALGWALNVAVMVPNHGMPVSGAALQAVGAPATADVAAGNLYKHVPLGGGTSLPWLADVVPVPPLRMIVSAGDVVMAGGLVLLVGAAVSRRQRAPGRARIGMVAPSA